MNLLIVSKDKVYMKHTKALLVALLCVLAISCNSDNEKKFQDAMNANETSENAKASSISLPLSKWTLSGVQDLKSKSVTPLKPVDERTYSITFVDDTTVKMYSPSNSIWLTLKEGKITKGMMTLVGDSHMGDAEKFYKILDKLDSYSISGEEIRFYYGDKGKCLLYKFNRRIELKEEI